MRTASVLGLLLIWVSTASAQTGAWQFRWHKGQVLHYRIEHVTSVAETLGTSQVKTTSHLKLVKRWKVLEVNAEGTAKLEMSLMAMRNEQKLPNGETILFDSNDVKKSTPGLAEQLMPLIGKPLAVLEVNSSGRVLSAGKNSLAKFEAEPPFAIVLSEHGIGTGQSWKRQYTLTLEPPVGVGEKYPGVQEYVCQTVAGPLATVAVKTTFKNMPESFLDQIPLIQKQPEGKVVFDVQNGRMHNADLTIHRDLENHRGAGSRYQFDSRYREEYVPN